MYEGKKVWATIPYPIMPVMCARKHWRPSMTIFRKSSDRKAWCAIRVERPLPEELKGLFSTSGQQSRDPLDPENLRHWQEVSGGDEEVDFDNLTDNDEETARQIHKEMLKERQDRSQKPKKLNRRSKGIALSRMQVLGIIARAIEKFTKSWEAEQAKHPSRVQRKAWRLWQRTLRQGSKDVFINEFTEKIMHLGSRLQKIRDEIAQLVWSTEKAVLKQAQSMQPTVVEQETAKWQRDVLQCLTAPEKPPPAGPKKPKSAKQDLASSDQKLADLQLRRYSTESSADEDDDASDSSHMSDFVVDDEVNAAEAQTAPKIPLMGAVNPTWPVSTGTGPLRPLFPNWGKKRMQMEAEQKAAEEKTTEQQTVDQQTTEDKTTEQQAKGATPPIPTIEGTTDSAMSSAKILSNPNLDIIDLTRSDSSEPAQHGIATNTVSKAKATDDLASAPKSKKVKLSKYGIAPETEDARWILDPNDLPAYNEVDEVGIFN